MLERSRGLGRRCWRRTQATCAPMRGRFTGWGRRCRKPRGGLRAGAMGAAERCRRCALRHVRAVRQGRPGAWQARARRAGFAGGARGRLSQPRCGGGQRRCQGRRSGARQDRRHRGRLAEKQAALRQAFPDYADLANPKPLALADAQALLGEGEALVLFLDLWQMGKLPEETIVFAVTRKEARWTSIPLGTRALRERVAALRCGLD